MVAAKPDSEEWNEFCTGPNASVWIHARCVKEMKDISKKDLAKIEACMRDMYCTMENVSSIPPTKLNRNEGRHGARQHLVQAFKSFQGRVYGVEGSINGTRAFFASAAVVKKDDKANPELLKRAADRVSTITAISGAQV